MTMQHRGMTMRWAMALAVTAVLAGCSASTSGDEPGVLRTFEAGDELVVPRAAGGTCSFDYRSQIHLVDPEEGIEWSLDVPWLYENPRLAVHDGMVFGSSFPVNGTVIHHFAVDLTDGSPIWQLAVDGSFRPLAYPLPYDDLVIVGDNHAVVGLDAETGEERWRIDAAWSTPVLTDAGLVLHPEEGAPPVVVDPATGEHRGDLFDSDRGETDQLHLAGDLVLVQQPRTLIAVDPERGDIGWRHDLAMPNERPYVDVVGDTILVSRIRSGPQQDRGMIHALDLATGEVRWDRMISEHAVPPDQFRDVILDRSNLAVLDLAGGAERWRIDPGEVMPTGEVRRSNASQPTDDLLLFSSPYRVSDPETDEQQTRPRERTVVAGFDAADGTIRWTLDRDEATVSPSIVVGDVLLVGLGADSDEFIVDDPEGGTILALDPTTGAVLWEETLRDPVYTAPIPLEDGKAVVASSDPSIFCG